MQDFIFPLSWPLYMFIWLCKEEKKDSSLESSAAQFNWVASNHNYGRFKNFSNLNTLISYNSSSYPFLLPWIKKPEKHITLIFMEETDCFNCFFQVAGHSLSWNNQSSYTQCSKWKQIFKVCISVSGFFLTRFFITFYMEFIFYQKYFLSFFF